MRGIINKKGAAHFEMIFAFAFFVGFVFFLFMVLKPQDTSTLSGSVIAALYDSFEEEVHTNLSSMFLKANYTDPAKSCFLVKLPGRIFFYALTDSHVTTLAGADVKSELEDFGSDGNLKVNKSDTFFRVSISSEFTDGGLSSCEDPIDYELGNVLERRVVSYSSLKNMSKEYLNDYEGLRSRLRVPPIFDFAIIAETLSGVDMEPQFGVPTSVEVQAQDYVVEVLNSSGAVINERFTLKIW